MYGVLLPTGEESQPPPIINHEDTNPPPMSLAPPPPGEFPSREALMDYLKEWGKHQGYAVVIGRSRANRLWIKCDRGGEYADKHLKDPENRKRKRKATRLTGCLFGVKASMKKDEIWRCHCEHPAHNHPPSEDMSVHPSTRRMNDEQMAKVNEMTEAGKTPVETLEALKRLWPEMNVLKRDIYNARKKYKTEKELQEVEEGSNDPQSFDDPNGLMPGPTRTGRWEWLEDGDEVKRRKKRGKANSIVPDSLASGPSTDATGLSSQSARGSAPPPPPPPPPIINMSNPYHSVIASQSSASQMGERDYGMAYPPQASRPFRHYQVPTPQTMPPRGYTSNTNADQMLQNSMSTRGRQVEPLPLNPSMTPLLSTTNQTQVLPNQTAVKPAPSGQVLMSRIERMEKEQNEQKSMLAQILSAVQGVGSSASGPKRR